MTNGDDRSVTARDIIGSIVQTGDDNRAELRTVQLPAPASVDIAATVAALRAELLAVDAPDRGKIDRALADAGEEVAKDAPDPAEVAGSVERALGYAKKAGDFSEHVGKVRDLVVQVGGWLGAASPYVAPLLAVVGLSL